MQRIRILGCLAVVGVLAFCSSASASIVVGGSSLLTQAYADQLESWLGEGPIVITRIFAKQTGDNAADFHAAADGQGRTFSVIEVLANSAVDQVTFLANNPAQIIGGYNPQSWQSAGSNFYNETPADADRTAFLFNLTTAEIQQQNLTSQGTSESGKYQTANALSTGPTFGGGHDLFVADDLSTGYMFNYSYGGTSSTNNILSGTSFYNRNDLGGMYGAIEVFTIAAAPVDGAVPEPAQLVVWSCLTALSACGVVLRRRQRQQPGEAGR